MKNMKNCQNLALIALQEVGYTYREAQEASWWILSHITSLSRSGLMHAPSLSGPQVQELSRILQEIKQYKPLQYILGYQPFLNLEIIVEPPILIPRPETEEWCSDLVKTLQKYSNPLHILDLCTGSGCIALALAQALPSSLVTGIDINPQAIALAQKNAAKNNIPNATFMLSDLFAAIPVHSFDIIVSNPPYISLQEYDQLPPHISAWEDKKALLADDQGLAIIKKIIGDAKNYLRTNPTYDTNELPRLVIEIGHTQAKAVKNIMHDAGFKTAVHQDLQGLDRVVLGYACI